MNMKSLNFQLEGIAIMDINTESDAYNLFIKVFPCTPKMFPVTSTNVNVFLKQLNYQDATGCKAGWSEFESR
jgi:hypothetical protein